MTTSFTKNETFENRSKSFSSKVLKLKRKWFKSKVLKLAKSCSKQVDLNFEIGEFHVAFTFGTSGLELYI